MNAPPLRTPGFYERHILPRLVELAMRNKEATRFRARLVPQARGVALEVGRADRSAWRAGTYAAKCRW